ncbi:MAG TPA: DUF6600 domain-containing protein [Kofleriaceae bacterium]
MTACYRQDPSFYSTLPEPTEVQGPPSGEIDVAWQASYAEDNPQGSVSAAADVSSDPNDPGYVMGACTDGEIDSTLDGYGEWVYIEGYGEVWRPYPTVVGVDFTPYETCGSWVWTDWGWTFACEWDWGWLPFHYGRWGWFDDYWAWQPDYEWTPAAVEWRGGGGYVGWRPEVPIIRDHRSGNTGPVVHDHRSGREHLGPVVHDHRGEGPQIRDHRTAKSKDWQWRFATTADFGKPRIRAHLYKSLAEGLRVTQTVARPPLRATVQPVRAESIMRGRLATASRLHMTDQRYGNSRVGPSRVEPDRSRGVQPGRVTNWQRSNRSNDSSSVFQPTYPALQPSRGQPTRAPSTGNGDANEPEQTFGGLPVTPTTPTPTPQDHPPRSPIVSSPTQPSFEPPTAQPPRGPDVAAPTQPSYQSPTGRGAQTPVQSSWQPQPSRGAQTPVQGSWQPTPSRTPTYTPPSQPTRAPERSNPPSYSPPRSSPPPSYSPPRSSPPSRSYSSSSNSNSSPPSRSYSSSSSSSSHSSTSYSPPSSSSHSSSSSSSSSSSHSSSSSSGGGFSSGARSHRH